MPVQQGAEGEKRVKGFEEASPRCNQQATHLQMRKLTLSESRNSLTTMVVARRARRRWRQCDGGRRRQRSEWAGDAGRREFKQQPTPSSMDGLARAW